MSGKSQTKQANQIATVLAGSLNPVVRCGEQVVVRLVCAGAPINDNAVNLAVGVDNPPAGRACAVVIVREVLAVGDNHQGCLAG